MDYKLCQLFDENQPDSCGKSDFNNVNRLFVLQDLTDTVCLRGMKEGITEIQLIRNRSEWFGYPIIDNKLICAKHRHDLGIYFRPTQCQYPDHEGNRNLTDQLGWKTYQKIKEIYPTFPFLGGVCKDCRKKINSIESDIKILPPVEMQEAIPIKISETIQSDSISISPFQYQPLQMLTTPESAKHSIKSIIESELSSRGSNYVPFESENENEKEKIDYYKNLCDSMFDNMGIKHPPYKIKKPVEETRLNEYLNAWNRFKSTALNVFCNAYAPGQSSKLKAHLIEHENKNQDLNSLRSKDLESYEECYNACKTAAARRAMLTMISTKFTKEELIEKFNVSKYQIDSARNRLQQYGPLLEPEKCVKTRTRLDMVKVEHFLNFLSSSSLLQVCTILNIEFYNIIALI